MFLLQYFTERQVSITGGLLSGLGYMYSGFLMTSVFQLFVGFSISGKAALTSYRSDLHTKRLHFGQPKTCTKVRSAESEIGFGRSHWPRTADQWRCGVKEGMGRGSSKPIFVFGWLHQKSERAPVKCGKAISCYLLGYFHTKRFFDAESASGVGTFK